MGRNHVTRAAREVQDATGASYSTCLRRVNDTLKGEDAFAGLRAFDEYMGRIRALPELAEGEMRCVQCLDLIASAAFGTFPSHRCAAPMAGGRP